MHFLGRTPVFVLGEEALLFAPKSGESRVAIHGGGILASAADGARIVTGGDDGRLVATDAQTARTELATDDKKRWIDQVALGPDGAVAWSAGKTAHVLTGKGEQRALRSAVDGRRACFCAERLPPRHRALQRRDALVSQRRGAKPEMLEWKGSHLGVTFSPDGRFLVTTMQEPTLHGWRIADAKHMRMSGYSARVRSLSGRAGGEFLATSGSEQLILWPFDGKDGPMGRQPTLLAPSRGARDGRRLPSASSRSWRPAMPTARCCWCASTTAR